MQLVRFRVDLGPRCSLGPGKIALLEAIADKGSLTHAAAKLGMSYRYAWLLLEDLKRSFVEPVTRATVGGRRGGGVELTRFGAELVRRYNLATRRIDAVARSAFAPLMARVVRPVRKASARTRARSVKPSPKKR
jgi:molybdate transport system regulatory protein